MLRIYLFALQQVICQAWLSCLVEFPVCALHDQVVYWHSVAPFTDWKWRCNVCLCINSIYDWTRHDCFEFSRNMSAVLSCHNFTDWFEVADIDVPTIRLRKGDAAESIRKFFYCETDILARCCSINFRKGQVTNVKNFRGPVTPINSWKCDMSWIFLTKKHNMRI